MLDGRLSPREAEEDRRLAEQIAGLELDYQAKTATLEQLHQEAGQKTLLLTLSNGRTLTADA